MSYKIIINIVLTKEKTNVGFEGSTSIQYNQRTFPTYWPSTSLTYSSEKLSTLLNASYFNENQNNELTNNILFNESSRIAETNTRPHIKGFLINLNLDYQLNPKTNVDARLSSNFSKNNEEATTKTTYNNIIIQSVDSTFCTSNKSVNLQHKLDC